MKHLYSAVVEQHRQAFAEFYRTQGLPVLDMFRWNNRTIIEYEGSGGRTLVHFFENGFTRGAASALFEVELKRSEFRQLQEAYFDYTRARSEAVDDGDFLAQEFIP